MLIIVDFYIPFFKSKTLSIFELYYFRRLDLENIGLVFSGGGGKGAYEIGVWKALKEFNIDKNIKVISGTSVGALNAALFSQGDLEKAIKVWMNISQDKILHINGDSIKNKIVSLPFSNFVLSKANNLLSGIDNFGIFSQEGLRKIIRENLIINHGNDFKIPIYICAFNIQKLIPEYFYLNIENFSNIENYLLASAAIPGIFSPIDVNGEKYFDGGLVDNTPVKPLLNENLKYIITVSLSRDPLLNDYAKNSPGIKFWNIVPNDDVGNLIKGTLNFNPDYAMKLMNYGYNDTKRILEEMYQFLLIEKKIIENAESIGKNIESFSTLVKQNVTLRKQFNNAIEQNCSSIEFLLTRDTNEIVTTTLKDTENDIETLLDKADKLILDDSVNDVVSSFKSSSNELEKILFEGLTKFSSMDGRINNLRDQKFISRVFNSITGKNQKIQAEIMGDTSTSLYCCYKAIRIMSERQMLTLDFMAAISNRLNYLMLNINNTYENDKKIIGLIKSVSIHFNDQFIQLEEKIGTINNRIDNHEIRLKMLEWKEFSVNRYKNLSGTEKIIYLTSDYYKNFGKLEFKSGTIIFDNVINQLGLHKEYVSINNLTEHLFSNNSNQREFLNESLPQHIFPIREDEKRLYPVLKTLEIFTESKTKSIGDITRYLKKEMNISSEKEIRGDLLAFELLNSFKLNDRKNYISGVKKMEMKDVYLQNISQCKSISESTGVEKIFSEKLSQIENEMKTFKVVVPLIGKFSAGKSRLLNEYLEQDILGVDTLAKTALATELKFSENESLVLNYTDGTKEIKDISQIDSSEFNYDKIQYMELNLNNQKLKNRNEMILVDMPGINSNVENHTKAIMNYVGRGNHFVVVFDIKSSFDDKVYNFLKEITLYNQGFSVVITKYAKVMPKERDGIRDTVRSYLKKVKTDDVVIEMTDSDEKDVIGFEKIINSIYERKDDIFKTAFSEKFIKLINDMIQYFERILDKSGMGNEEIENEKKKLEKELDYAEKTVNEQLVNLDKKLSTTCVDNVVSKIRSALNSNYQSLVSAARGGNSSLNSTISDMLRPVIVNGIKEEVSKEVENLKHNIGARIGDTIPDFNVTIDIKPQNIVSKLVSNPLLIGGIVTLILGPIFGLIAGIVGQLFGGKKAQDDGVEKQIVDSVIPSVTNQSISTVKEGFNQVKVEICDDIKKEYEQKKSELVDSLNRLKEESSKSLVEFEAKKELWRNKLGELKNINV